MEKIITYKAFDGTMFNSEDECFSYESKHTHHNLFHIKFFDKNGQLYFIDKNKMFSDKIYYKCEEIYIPEESFKDFLWLSRECGWYEFYEQISHAGHWKRTVLYDWINDGKWDFIND